MEVISDYYSRPVDAVPEDVPASDADRPSSEDMGRTTILAMLIVALLATGWSFLHTGDASRLVLVPVTVICGLVYPPVLPLLLFAAYLTPEILMRGSSIVTHLPWIIMVTMLVNVISRFWRPSRLTVPPSAIFMFLLFAGFVLSAELNSSSRNLASMNRFLSYPLFFLALWQYRTEFDRRILIWTLAGCSVVLSVWTIWRAHMAGGPAWFERGTGLFDPNYLSCWICLGLIPLFTYLFHGRHGVLQIILKAGSLAAICTAGLALIYCESRSAAVALCLTVVVIILLGGLFSRRYLITATVIGAMVASVFLFWQSELLSGYKSRFLDIPVEKQGNRIELIKSAYRYWMDTSLDNKILGSGTGSTYVVLDGEHSHNNFTEMLLDYGVFGLFSFLGLLWIAWRSSLRHEGYFRTVSIAWLVFLVISSMGISPFYYNWGWQILALVIPVIPVKEARDELQAEVSENG